MRAKISTKILSNSLTRHDLYSLVQQSISSTQIIPLAPAESKSLKKAQDITEIDSKTTKADHHRHQGSNTVEDSARHIDFQSE